MPSKNVMKIYVPETFYHVYSRGWNKMKIFKSAEDYAYFESLLARHLSLEPVKDEKGRDYAHHRADIQLNAYCLMGNHFHLLIYQHNERALTKLMSSVLTAYTVWHNKKYQQRGGLFESTYKAIPIIRDEQLMHITRYIHLNRADYKHWSHSSYQDYLIDAREWLETQPILELFNSSEAYADFVANYKSVQRERDEIKHWLAAV